jgi:hypothetical protein
MQLTVSRSEAWEKNAQSNDQSGAKRSGVALNLSQKSLFHSFLPFCFYLRHKTFPFFSLDDDNVF